MFQMWFAVFLVILGGPLLGKCSHLSTHWVVTENGLINPRANSPYELARPYDLIGFIKQEEIYNSVINHYQELTARQNNVNKQWLNLHQSSDFNSVLDMDSDCEYARKFNSKLNHLNHAFLDSIRRADISEKYFNFPNIANRNDPPDCEKYSSLPYSMFTFEHLEAMINRNNLSFEADFQLRSLVFPTLTLNSFGSHISDSLQANHSSWFHYTLASVYWKSVGNAVKAMECSRRAVYYAPRKYKDIALLSLGLVFLRCQKKNESLTVISAAVDHAPQYAINHFALGDAYFLLEEVNKSLASYDRSLELDSQMELAKKMKHYTTCYKKLMDHLDFLQNSLQDLQSNLTEYSALEVNWWKQQSLLLNAMNTESQSFTDLTRSSMDSICHTMSQVMGLDFCSLNKMGDKSSDNIQKKIYQIRSLVTKSEHLIAKDGKIQSGSDSYKDLFSPSTKKDDFNKILKNSDDEGPIDIYPGDLDDSIEKIKREVIDSKEFKSSKYDELEGGPVLYPSTYKVNRNREDFDKSDEWPTSELCKEWSHRFPINLDTIYPVFLPLENKGLRLISLLSEKIGLTLKEEHPLPWRPPVCKEVKGTTNTALPKLPKSQNADTVPVDHLRWLLLNYVSDGNIEAVKHMHEAEIGQRILTAYKKRAAPPWVMYTLSSLYWRVRRNSANALGCLQSAARLAPARHLDLVHVSTASLLLEAGHVEDALVYASQAFQINMFEPATNFVLSLIHMMKNNRMVHIYHMRQVVRVEPDFMDGLARTLLLAWSCNSAITTTSKTKITDEQFCQKIEQNDGDKTVCMTEEHDTLTLTSIKKLHHGYKLGEEISSIVRLLDLETKRLDLDVLSMEDELKDELERRELAHIKLRYIILDNVLKNCGEEDCSKLYPAKATDVHSQSCQYQKLRNCYWLPYLHLETLLRERGISVEHEFDVENSVYGALPDCEAPPPGSDPVLEWVRGVDGSGWRPAGALLGEVTALLDRPDVADVGAVLAYHLRNSGSWVRLVVGGVWCAGVGRGACALRCSAAALHAAPQRHRDIPLLALFAILLAQDRVKEAKQVAYFALPLAPKNKFHLFVAGISHTYLGEYSSAIRMFRLALTQSPDYAQAKTCLHASMCLLVYSDTYTE